jgi:hypothetical protein
MRRALLLAALAAPALAAAQTPTAGQVLNGTTKGTGEPIPDDQYINIDECNGAVTSDLELNWNVALESGTVNGGVFRIYASNKAAPTTAPSYCLDNDPTNNTYTFQVGADVTATAGKPIDTTDRAASAFVKDPPYTCTEGQEGQTITVCVHYFDRDGARTGWAFGSLVLALRRPPPPSGVVIESGDGALNVQWTRAPDPTGTEAVATGYRVEAREQGGSAVVATVDVTDVRARLSGLTNGQVYEVLVYSLSAAKNTSTAAATGEGEPKPVIDFWDYYRSVDGREVGGCAAGAAGPLALLGLAALLALHRRRS